MVDNLAGSAHSPCQAYLCSRHTHLCRATDYHDFRWNETYTDESIWYFGGSTYSESIPTDKIAQGIFYMSGDNDEYFNRFGSCY